MGLEILNVWGLVFLRLGVRDSYVWGLDFLRLEVSFLTFDDKETLTFGGLLSHPGGLVILTFGG